MIINNLILWIIGFGILIGAGDRILNNKFGLGEKFEEGLNSMGNLALSMVGIISLSPVISNVLSPIIIPIYKILGIDPAMFASILANDMGGYHLALALGESLEIQLYSGLIVSSMLGCTIVFSIPVGFSLIENEDKEVFAKGLLIGFLSIPFGSLIGGITMKIDIFLLLINTIPIILMDLLFIIGLKFFENVMIKIALIFGKIILYVSTIGLVASIFESLSGIVLIKGMIPLRDSMSIVINTSITLLGAFPMLTLVIKLLDKQLRRIGECIGLDSSSVVGIIVSLANSIPVFKMLKDMNHKGKIINIAWLVGATSTLGAHLGFTTKIKIEMVIPVIISKLSAGAFALGIALILTKSKSNLCINKDLDNYE